MPKFVGVIMMTLALMAVTACSTNPVTGRNEFNMVSRAQEIQVGQQQYGPSQQSQGGRYEEDPALTRYVNEVGQRLAAVSDNDLPYEFVVLNSSVPNAWALPGGKIAVNRGLLTELNNEAELAAVLGHEVVHAAARHGAQSMTRGQLLQGAMLLGALASAGSEYANYIVGGAALGAQLITQRYGRDAERQSDEYGIRYMVRAGYDPRAAVSLQETFVRLSEGQQQDWLSGLFASHPPSQERVRNNQAMVDELLPTLQGRDLELGELRYQQATAHLRQVAPAYELALEAQAAFKQNNVDSALSLLERAIAIAPQESSFYGLKGDILFYRGDHQQALAQYEKALSFNASYYAYHLGKGMANSALGHQAVATSDLERSVQLLPTAMAMNELGNLALASNDLQAAKQYYGVASGGSGAVAQQAARAFARLDVSDNPERYIGIEAGIDQATGMLMARIQNASDIKLGNIILEFVVRGRGIRQRIVALEGSESVIVASGLQLPADFVRGRDELLINVLGVEVL